MIRPFFRSLLCFLLVGTTATAAEMQRSKDNVTLQIEAKTIKKNRMELTLGDSFRVRLDCPERAKFGKVNISPSMGKVIVYTPRKTEQGSWRQTLQVQPWQPGEYALPVPTVIVTKGDSQKEVKFEPISVHVRTTIKEANPDLLRPIPGWEPLPETPKEGPNWWPLLVAGALLLLAISGILVAIFLRKQHPPPDPHKEWIEQFIFLRNSCDQGQTDIRYCYEQLSVIVRCITTTHADSPHVILSSPEIVQQFAKLKDLSEKEGATLTEILNTMDLARFSPLSPSAEEFRTAVTWLIDFLRSLKESDVAQ